MRARSLLLSRLARSLLLLSLGALGFATVGFGALSITTPATASFSVALDGTDQTPVYQLPITVTSSGQQNGWHLLASATQFVNGTYTFPATASQVLSVTPPAACSGGSCSLPTSSGSIVYAVTLPNTGGAAIYSAASGTGQATNVMTANVQVVTPANVYAGTYTSTVTVQIVAGP
jgi:hypothetical protein